MEEIKDMLESLYITVLIVASIVFVVWFCFVEVPKLRYDNCVIQGRSEISCGFNL